MKYTTNQTQRFCTTNQYWLDYANNYGGKFHSGTLLNRKIKTWSGDLKTEICNTQFYLAHKEFDYHFKKLEDHQIFHGILPTLYRDDIKYTAYCQMQHNGTWKITIYSSGTDHGHFNYIPFTERRHNLSFDYNGYIDTEHFQKAVSKYFDQYLYAKGVFRAWQEYQLFSKMQLRNTYMKQVTSKTKYQFQQDEEAVRMWILRKFKIDIRGVDFEDGVKYAKKHGAFEFIKELHYMPSLEAFLDYDGDEDGIEEAVDEILSDYPKNAVFV